MRSFGRHETQYKHIVPATLGADPHSQTGQPAANDADLSLDSPFQGRTRLTWGAGAGVVALYIVFHGAMINGEDQIPITKGKPETGFVSSAKPGPSRPGL